MMASLLSFLLAANSVAQSVDLHQHDAKGFVKRSHTLDRRFEARTFKSSIGRSVPYRLFRPHPEPGGLPLIIYLHGGGGRGHENRKQISGGNVFGTYAWATEESQRAQPAFVLAPQTEDYWDRDHLESVFELVQELSRELPIHKGMIYLTGQSMGGKGAWDLVALHPDAFAAAVIVCGGGNASQAALAASTPLWIFHGALDQSVSVADARLIVQALHDRGAAPKYTEYPQVGHNVWEWAYAEPSLSSWMFAQRRPVDSVK